jgi:S1-C subfamily serine protease
MPNLFLPFILLAHLFFSPITLAQRVIRSVVLIQTSSEVHPQGVCTGFVVNSAAGEVLTANHCTEDNGVPVDEMLVDGEPSYVIRTDGNFSLVHSRPMEKPPLELRDEPIPNGSEVVTTGYAYGHLVEFTRHVAAHEGGDIYLDGPLAPGMSGGPVVDTHNRVVGLNQASSPVLGIVCGQNEIRFFLHPYPEILIKK